MWLSVGFPTCPRCGNNGNKSYHKDCPNGAKKPMEINSDTAYVKCPSCGQSWYIKDSNYFCTCDYVFSADDVLIEIDAIIANAKLIAAELQRTAATQARIAKITCNEIESTTETVIKKRFGEKVWSAIKKSIPAIIVAIKTWLNIP